EGAVDGDFGSGQDGGGLGSRRIELRRDLVPRGVVHRSDRRLEQPEPGLPLRGAATEALEALAGVLRNSHRSARAGGKLAARAAERCAVEGPRALVQLDDGGAVADGGAGPGAARPPR